MKTLAALLVVATPALADSTIEIVPTCVTIDVDRDAPPEAERADARDRLVRALELQDRLVVAEGCRDTITLWHERVETGVVVHVRNALGGRKLRVPVDADMFETYARLARGLYETPTEPPFETPPVATIDEVPPSDVPGAMRAWSYRLGYGSLGDAGAMSAAVGYRLGSNATVVDFSLAFLVSNDAEVPRRSTAFRGQVLRFRQPHATSSVYGGGGASFATTTYTTDGMSTTESGMQLDGTLGIEWNRDGEWRYALESNVGLPFYTVGDRYPASFAISFGIAH